MVSLLPKLSTFWLRPRLVVKPSDFVSLTKRSGRPMGLPWLDGAGCGQGPTLDVSRSKKVSGIYGLDEYNTWLKSYVQNIALCSRLGRGFTWMCRSIHVHYKITMNLVEHPILNIRIWSTLKHWHDEREVRAYCYAIALLPSLECMRLPRVCLPKRVIS